MANTARMGTTMRSYFYAHLHEYTRVIAPGTSITKARFSHRVRESFDMTQPQHAEFYDAILQTPFTEICRMHNGQYKIFEPTQPISYDNRGNIGKP